MKTERRHELQTNVLADSLAHGSRPSSPTAAPSWPACSRLVVALFAWRYVSTQNTRQAIRGMERILQADGQSRSATPQRSGRALPRHDGRRLVTLTRANLAAQCAAPTNCSSIARRPAIDCTKPWRHTVRSSLEATESTILQRATYGLARAQEAMGELEKARATNTARSPKNGHDSPFAAGREVAAQGSGRTGSTKQFLRLAGAGTSRPRH